MLLIRPLPILLLLLAFQSCIFARKHSTYYQRTFEEGLLDAVLASIDSDDHVDIELWNKLNDDDIENMPQTDDYSDEHAAIRWLRWYTKVAKRYRQVCLVHSRCSPWLGISFTRRLALCSDGIIKPISQRPTSRLCRRKACEQPPSIVSRCRLPRDLTTT